LLVAGDYGILADMLKQVYEAEERLSGRPDSQADLSKRQVAADESYNQGPYAGGGLDIEGMDLERKPHETESCLEFLLNIITKSFVMKPT